jgi:hypothetical protein
MKSNLFKFVSAISVLALAAMACGLVTPGGSGLPTISTAVSGGGDSGGNGIDVQPTQPPADNGGGSGGKKLLSDNFESRSSNWGVGDDTDYSVQYVDGALQFKIIASNMKVYSGPNGTDYKNVHIEVDAISSGSDSKAAFGILCNQQVINDEFYFGYITASGEYGIVKAVFIDDDVELTSGKSDLIPQNAASYRVGFDCAADGTMTLSVNGQQIATASDTEYSGGLVGAIAWSGDVESGTIVSFDNFVVSELP